MSLRDRLKLGKDVNKEKTDFVGTKIHKTDIYEATVSSLYLTETKNGATMANITLTLGDGNEFSNMQCLARMVNGESSTTFVKDGNEYPLPGYTLIDDLTMLLLGSELEDTETKPKYVKAYNSDTKQQEDTEVDFYTEVVDKKVKVAIAQVTKNKYDAKLKQDTNEKQEVNEIIKFLDPEDSSTVAELIHDSELDDDDEDSAIAGTWAEKWLEKNKGEVIDKFKEVTSTASGGRPTKSRKLGRASKEDDSESTSSAESGSGRKKRLLGRNK